MAEMLHRNLGQEKEQDKCLDTEERRKTNEEGSKKCTSINTTAKVPTRHLLVRQDPLKLWEL